MYIQLSCVVVDPDSEARQEMVNFLIHQGIHVAGQLLSADQMEAWLSRTELPQVAVVNLDPSPSATLRKIAPLVRRYSSVSFFVLSQMIDPNLLMDAMQIGIAQFVPLPIEESRFLAGIERVAQHHGMGKRAKVIHLVPSSGGCGSTTVACNVAVTLAAAGRTVLVDLDLACGAVANAFDLHPRYTIADLMDLGEKLDKQLLDNALLVHEPTGLAILPRPALPEEAQRATQPGLNRLLTVLGRAFDYVVIDSQMCVDPLYATAIQMADLNVVVMQLTVPSARNAERYVDALRRMGIDQEKVRVVVNRFLGKRSEIEPATVERTLGLKVSWLIPNDFKNAMCAINYGQPVVLRAPKTELSSSLCELAKTLNGKSCA